ncbi:MAG: hypothetical protein ACKKL5_02485 [Candidatus Komeilibacteria bacterium]
MGADIKETVATFGDAAADTFDVLGHTQIGTNFTTTAAVTVVGADITDTEAVFGNEAADNFLVKGATTIDGALTATGAIQVVGADITDTQAVFGDNAADNFLVKGATTIDGALTATGAIQVVGADITDTEAVFGNEATDNFLVKGATTIDGALTATGAIQVVGADITDAEAVFGNEDTDNFLVKGATTIDGAFTSGTSGTVTVVGANISATTATFGDFGTDTFSVAGNTNIAGGATTTGVTIGTAGVTLAEGLSVGIGVTNPTSLLHIGTATADYFKVSATQATSYVPFSMEGTGDVTIANDIYMSNATSSTISSKAPLYITAGDVATNSNLVLEGRGTGKVYVDDNFEVTGNMVVSGGFDPGTFSGDLLPTTDGTYDLGSNTYEWQDLWIDGTANIDTLAATTMSGALAMGSNNITGAGTITAGGLITGTAGATISGAAINLNASSNFATNINTGTSSGTVSIGNTNADVAITDPHWSITGAGAGTFTQLDSDNLRLDGNTLSSTDANGAITINPNGTGGINLGTTNSARTINIGTGTAVDTINIGTGATGADVITIGGGVGTVAINSGDWDISTTGVATNMGTYNSQTISSTANFTGTVNVVTSLTSPIVQGSTDAGGDLTLKTTTNATKGHIFFGDDANSAYDDVNNRLGIGTTAPASSLHVLSSAAGNAPVRIEHAATPSSDYLQVASNGATGGDILTINSTGQVGIGTTSPGSYYTYADDLVLYKVDGVSNQGAGLSLISGSNDISVIAFGDGMTGSSSYAGSIMYNHADNSMRLSTNANEAIRIDSSGEVGIGTTDPGAKLDVYTSAGVNGVSQAQLVWSNGAQEAAFLGNSDGVGTIGLAYYDDDSGNVFSVYSSDVNAEAYFAGNVGIGTTAPSAQLDVIGTTGATSSAGSKGLEVFGGTGGVGSAGVGGAGGGNSIQGGTGGVGNGTSGGEGYAGGAGGTNIIQGGTGGVGATGTIGDIGGAGGAGGVVYLVGGAGGAGGASGGAGAGTSGDGGNVYIYGGAGNTNGDVILAHTGSAAQGKVGIGTTAPGYLLDVNGSLNAGAATVTSLTSSGAVSGTTGTFSSVINVGGTSGRAYNSFSTSAAKSRSNIANADDLYVAGDIEVDTYLFVDGNVAMAEDATIGISPSTERIVFNGGSDVIQVLSSDFSVGTSDFYVDDSAGQIGIGTTSPSADLDVAGTFKTSGVGDVTIANDIYMSNGVASEIQSKSSLTIQAGDAGTNSNIVLDPQGTGGVVIDMPAGTSTQGVCHSGASAGSGGASARTLLACNGAPADYAEWYRVKLNENVEAGDIVLPEYEEDNVKGKNFALVKSGEAYARPIVGVISTEPYRVIGENIFPEGAEISEGTVIEIEGVHYAAVALNGRVSVKVSAENGSIGVGDMITTSTIPGYGMKLNEWESGPIVGKALESLESGVGLIEVFMSIGYYSGNYAKLIQNNLLLNDYHLQFGTSNAWTVNYDSSNTGNLLVTSNQANSNFVVSLADQSDSLLVNNGNLQVGDGSPDLSLAGNSLYVQGSLEADGDARLDGALTVAGSTTLNGPLDIIYDGDTTIGGDLVLDKTGGSNITSSDQLTLSSTSGQVQIDDELVIGNDNVGIGSITSDSAGVTVKADAGNSGQVRGISLELDDNAGQSALTIMNSDSSAVGTVDSLGNLALAGSVNSDLSVVAQMFPVTTDVGGQLPDTGDIVITANDSSDNLIRSQSEYQNNVIGVVTAKAAVTLDNDVMGRAIALAGTVDIKVNDSNGAIAAGDYLTTSATPGVAMKATQAGPVVAKALESFSGSSEGSSGVSEIKAFIHVSWYDPLSDNLLVSGTLTVGGDTDLQGGVILGNASDDLIEVKGKFKSALLADSDNIYNLGDDTNRWASGYFGTEVKVDNLSLTNNQISTTNDLAIKSVEGNMTLQTTALDSTITLKPADGTAALEVNSDNNLATLVGRGGYLRVGMGSTADHVTNENDLYVAGSMEVNGDLYIAGDVLAPRLTDSIQQQIQENLVLKTQSVYAQDDRRFTWQSGNFHDVATVTTSDDKWVVVYSDADDNDSGHYIIFDRDGSEQTRGIFNSGATNNTQVVAMSGGQVMIVYTDAGNSNYGTLAVVNSAGQLQVDETVFNSAATDALAAVALNNGNIFLSYSDNGTAKYTIITPNYNIVKGETALSIDNVSSIKAVQSGQEIIMTVLGGVTPALQSLTIDLSDYSVLSNTVTTDTVNDMILRSSGKQTILAYVTATGLHMGEIDHNALFTAWSYQVAGVEKVDVQSLAGERWLVVTSAAGQLSRVILDQAGNVLLARAAIAASGSDWQLTADQQGRAFLATAAITGLSGLSWDETVGYDLLNNQGRWHSINVNVGQDEKVVLAMPYNSGWQYSDPISLTAGDNDINLGFATYEFTSRAGDNYFSLPGRGLGVADIRGISDEEGRTYQAKFNNKFFYIPDMGAAHQVTVTYALPINSQAMTIVGGIDDSQATINSAVTLSAAQANSVATAAWSDGTTALAFVDSSDQLAKINIYNDADKLVATKVLSSTPASAIAMARTASDDNLVAWRSGQDLYSAIVNKGGAIANQRHLSSQAGGKLAIVGIGKDSEALFYIASDQALHAINLSYDNNTVTPDTTIVAAAVNDFASSIMPDGNIWLTWSDTAGRVAVLGDDLQIISSATFQSFAPVKVATSRLLDNNYLIGFIDSSDNSVKYMVFNDNVESVVGTTMIGNNASKLISSRLLGGQSWLLWQEGVNLLGALVAADGTVQIDSTTIATGSLLNTLGNKVIYQNGSAILRSEVLPWTGTNLAVGNISQADFVFEDYSLSDNDQAIDSSGDNNNSANGDVAENMTVRVLNDQDVRQITGMTVEEFNTYEYTYCDVKNNTNVVDTNNEDVINDCAWEQLPAAGDVVVADYAGTVMAVKSVQANARNIVGVVTTDPAVILKKNLEGRTIVLTGTTPVNVSLENGPIAKGDLLTTATAAGYAMKATQRTAGTIGVALEAFDPVASCQQQTRDDYQAQLLVEYPEWDEAQVQEAIDALDISSCADTASQYGQVKVLLSINNPVVTASGSVITIVSGDDVDSSTIDLSIVEYEEFGNVVVKGDAIFGGKITVAKAEFLGNVVVAGNVKLAGDLELAGAITQDYWDGSDGNLTVGDAVYIAGANTVNITWADDDSFHPAIGLAVQILPFDLINKSKLADYVKALGYEDVDSLPTDVRSTIRLVKVASAGVVGGFANLQPGNRYYLATASNAVADDSWSDINDLLAESAALTASINDQQVAVNELLGNSEPTPTNQRSLSIIPPQSEQAVKQIMGVAKSQTELLIMPSLNYQGGNSDAAEIVEPASSAPVVNVSPVNTSDDTIVNVDNSATETTSAEDDSISVEQADDAISSDPTESDDTIENNTASTTDNITTDSSTTTDTASGDEVAAPSSDTVDNIDTTASQDTVSLDSSASDSAAAPTDDSVVIGE